jgi:enterochelin esterase-like enzyme
MKHLFRGKRINNDGWVEGFYYFCDWIDSGSHFIRQQKDSHFIDYKVDPETVVYIPNEELTKRWEDIKNKNREFNSLNDAYIQGVAAGVLHKCISELKEAGK